MKIVKFSVLALALGLFISSCGSSNTENQTEETTIEETNEIEMAPEAEEAPAVIDSTASDSTSNAPVTEDAHEGHNH